MAHVTTALIYKPIDFFLCACNKIGASRDLGRAFRWFFLLSECCNRYRIIEQFGSRSDPKFCQALIRVQIDGKSYHNMTFIYNQIRFSRDSAHLFDTNFLIKQIRSKLRSEIVWHRFFAVPAFIGRFFIGQQTKSSWRWLPHKIHQYSSICFTSFGSIFKLLKCKTLYTRIPNVSITN